MNSNKKTGRIAGALLLFIFISGVTVFQMLQSSILTSKEFIIPASENENQLILSTIVGIFIGVTSIEGVGVTVLATGVVTASSTDALALTEAASLKSDSISFFPDLNASITSCGVNLSLNTRYTIARNNITKIAPISPK